MAICSFFLSGPEDDDANAFAVIELRLRQAVRGIDIFVLSSKESDGSGSDFIHWGKDGTGFSSFFRSGSGLRLILEDISFKTICRSLMADVNSEDFLSKKKMALLKRSNRSRKNLLSLPE